MTTTRIPLDVAVTISSELSRRLIPINPNNHILGIKPVGGVRRKSPSVKDLDLLMIVDKIPTSTIVLTMRKIRLNDMIQSIDVISAGKRKQQLIARTATNNFRVDIFVTTPSELPYALFHFTGPKEYNIRTRAHAKRNGLRLNQYGLYYYDSPKKRKYRGSNLVRTEKELTELLGISWRVPTQR